MPSSNDDASVLTARRQRGVEMLDDPAVDPAIRQRAIADLMRSNRWLGGLRTARLALRDVAKTKAAATMLDVGTGLADIPDRVRRDAERSGTALITIGVDEAASLLAAARAAGRLSHVVAASALALPFRNRSVDVATCSQLLHHFEGPDARRVLAELNRVARRAVAVNDLRRSRFAAIGFWMVSFVFRFHPVTRHDGVVSVMRGFTAAELNDLVRSATGVAPTISRRLLFRLTAQWSPRMTA
jgi:ubiquinone/menaquinone biosynthesis C-methylase UbiE